MTIGDKIQYMRKKAGLSQEQLADAVGVSRQAVSKWETGEATPEVGKLLLLTRAFNVTADWLISDQGPDAPIAPDRNREEPREEPRRVTAPRVEYYSEEPEEPEKSLPTWLERMPGPMGRFIRRYGWIAGVKIAVIGGVLCILAGILGILTDSFFTVSDPPYLDTATYSMESVDRVIIHSGDEVETVSPVYGSAPVTVTAHDSTARGFLVALTGFFTGAGITLAVIGAAAALSLRRART